MKLSRLLVLTIFSSFIGLNTSAQTPGCTSGAEAVAGMWNSFHSALAAPGLKTLEPVLPSELEVSPNEYRELIALSIITWNDYEKSDWATIGPRSLTLDNPETGTIWGQTSRTFILAPSATDSVRITIRKVNGRARTGVSVCTQTVDGSRQSVAEHNFPNTNNPLLQTFLIENATDKVISIAMRNYSVANKFEYIIEAKIPAPVKKRRRFGN